MGKQVVTAFGIIVGLIVLGLFGFLFYTKSISSGETVSLTNDQGLEIEITYSRPLKNGRVLFGKDVGALAPYGKIWRTGANEATEITVNRNIMVSGKKLNAGSYTLYSIPNEFNWTIIFNSELNQWGAFTYNPQKDVLRVEVPITSSIKEMEIFTIGLTQSSEKIEMSLNWGKTSVTMPITTI
jgi:hypothetical protein